METTTSVQQKPPPSTSSSRHVTPPNSGAAGSNAGFPNANTNAGNANAANAANAAHAANAANANNLDLSAPQASSLLASAGPPHSSGPAIPAGTGPGGTPTTALSVAPLIVHLCQRPDPASATNSSAVAGQNGSEAKRETALLELSKKREQYEDLALVLWHSFGVMSSLLQEIIAVYPLLSPPALTAHASNRVCNALALLQCVASHQDTRALFLQGECES